MEDIYKEMAVRFKEFQVKTGIKTEKITKETGWKDTKVSDLRNRKQKITPEIAIELKIHFNLSPCWLTFGEGEMLCESQKPLIKFEQEKSPDEEKSTKEELMELRSIVESLAKRIK